MTDKDYGVLLYVEGDTEEEFYRFLLEWLDKTRKRRPKMKELIIKNLKGIGGFKRIALRYYINHIRDRKLPFSVILAYDTDVFEFSSLPPVDWKRVDYLFGNYGVQSIFHIQQRSMIEDWFLGDKEGLCRYLEIPIDTAVPPGDDANKRMQSLFHIANKMYYKGHYTRNFLDDLDIGKIYKQQESSLQPLVDLLYLPKTQK